MKQKHENVLPTKHRKGVNEFKYFFKIKIRLPEVSR